jgi:DNA-binding NarL/FixJ family response regulator
MIKIAITDDHTIFRKSLLLLINTFGEIQVVMEAANGRELLDQLPHMHVDIVLLDLQMPEMDGFATCEELHQSYPDIKILILSHLDTVDTITKVMDLGVDGYFTKSANPAELKQAILNLNEKGFYFEKKLSAVIEEILDSKPNRAKEEQPANITRREIEIIKLSAAELSGKEIAHRLSISLRTVEVHKKNLMEKTASKNFLGVVLYALSHELLSLSDLNER